MNNKNKYAEELKNILSKVKGYSVTTWTTRNGQVLNIDDMSERHLYNTLSMVKRQVKEMIETEFINEAFNNYCQSLIKRERNYERNYK